MLKRKTHTKSCTITCKCVKFTVCLGVCVYVSKHLGSLIITCLFAGIGLLTAAERLWRRQELQRLESRCKFELKAFSAEASSVGCCGIVVCLASPVYTLSSCWWSRWITTNLNINGILKSFIWDYDLLAFHKNNVVGNLV